MRVMIVLCLSAILAGCATEAELAAQQEREAERMVRIYGPACERLGYAGKSDPWRDCVIRLSLRDSLYFNRFPTATNCFGGVGYTQCTSF